jgi:condensin complex subunit 3
MRLLSMVSNLYLFNYFWRRINCSLERYWNELTPESALVARVFVEHCINAGEEAFLEGAALPVVTAFAFNVQEAYNTLLRLMQEDDEAQLEDGDEEDEEEKRDRREEDLAKAEVILGELLKIAVKLDYSDEIGRRKLFSVVSECSVFS